MGDCAAAKTSVWWDIDRCAVPPGGGRGDPHRIAHSVIAALVAAGYTGPVSISAYGDATRIAPPVLAALSATGISLNHVPAGAKDGTDKKMIVDMLFWAFDNPPPGNYLLISGDQDFSDLLHRLRMKRYTILLAQPSCASASSRVVPAAAAKTVWSWEKLVAGEQLLLAEPIHSSTSLDASKCLHSKAHAVTCSNVDSNVKSSNQSKAKFLQKYVKKTNAVSRSASNQDQAASVDGFSDDFAGSTASEQDRTSVSSSSSSSDSMEVDLPSLLGTPLVHSSAVEPVVPTSSEQVGSLDKFIIGGKISTSAELLPKNGTLDLSVSNGKHHQMYMQSQSSEAKSKLHSEYNMGDKNAKVGNQRKSKPLQKYVKKTNITSSPASNHLDSDGTPDSSVVKTISKLDHLSVLSSSNSESLEGAKVDNSSLLGIFSSSQPSVQTPVVSTQLSQVRAPHESILGKKPSTSTEHALRDGTHDFGVSIGRHDSTFQQSQSPQAQINMGDNNRKSRNRHKVTQCKQYVKKTNITTSSAHSEMELDKGFPGSSKGSILGCPSNSMLSSSSSEYLDGIKLSCSTPLKNPPLSLSSVHKPITPAHLQHVGAEFIFGKNPSTSTECVAKNENFNFDGTNGHNDSACQQAQSSLLPKQHKSAPTNPQSAASHSYPINSDVGSSYPASTGFNGVSSPRIQTLPSSLVLQNLPDIFTDISRLTVSECPPGMPNISGHPRGPHERGSDFHPGSDVSTPPSHPIAHQSVKSPSSNCSQRPPHPPSLSCNMQNPGDHVEDQDSSPCSSEPEGTIRNILHALRILKTEKLFPTESNIADCIRYGEMNLSGFDVKKALELAIRHQAVIMKKLVNDMPLFVAKDESIWKCVNVTNSYAKHSKETLDTVHRYISSTDGRSAMKNSQSRYQAASIIKKMCLQHHALGDVLQILHIVIVRKKWLLPHSSGWQPLYISTTVVDATAGAVGEARS